MPRLAALLLAAAVGSAPFGASVAQRPAPPGAPATPAPSTPEARAEARAEARDSATQAVRDSVRSRRTRRGPARRQPVTPELDQSAFADATARSLLGRARAARLAQDSALRAYDARTYQRMSVGLGVRRFGRERLLFRGENAARVRWSRQQGIWIEPVGARAVAPAFKEAEADFDLGDLAPLPYFPGRESLWLPSGDLRVARAEVDERDLLHPLAAGAEAYYRYATGDSVRIQLPNGERLTLRELRITARRPDWRAFVGSFWFDTERGNLVRAGYRLAADMDIWQIASEEARRDFEEAMRRADSAATPEMRERARRAARAEKADDDVPALVKGLVTPVRATISSITVEYGLHEGRFWLPRSNVAEAEAEVGFLRVPVRFEERYRYDAVNGAAPLPRVPTPTELGLADDSTSYAGGSVTIGGSGSADTATTRAGRLARDTARVREYAARVDSLQRRLDSALTRGAMARGDSVPGDTARGDSARVAELRRRVARARARATLAERRRDECARDSTYFAGIRTLWDDSVAMRVAVRRPCDPTALARSPELQGSLLDQNEAVWGTAERDALLAALESFDLQPAWGPQPPQLRTGLGFLRFNRVEGLSVGGEATSVLGLGYTASATARLGVSDLVPNAELALARSNGRTTRRLALFHRLGVANDDWGSPLGFGASLANLLYARDEGFYYRSWGAELSGSRTPTLGAASVGWRLFLERQRGAVRELRQTITGVDFTGNIAGDRVTALGAGVELGRTFGQDPTRTRLATRLRLEGAGLDWWWREGVSLGEVRQPGGEVATVFRSPDGARGYGRVMAEGTLSRGLGPLAAALTGGAGVIEGIGGGALRERLPAQRLFYVGGLQTVRGQFARPDGAGYVGNSFWLARAEVGTNVVSARPVAFYDVGWAGGRRDFTRPGRPLSGGGGGVSFLDGLVRMDLARGIWPERRTRFDLSVEGRF